MPTSKKTPAKKSAAKKASASATRGGNRKSASTDAIALLKADHKHVSDLFDQFEKARSDARKKALAAQICNELTVHAQIEEEIFYPAFKAALKDKEMVPEALVEHGSVKDLISAVQEQEPSGGMFEARVTVMGEFVKHHVKEEEKQMFAKARKSNMDLAALGEALATRKQELMASDAALRSARAMP